MNRGSSPRLLIISCVISLVLHVCFFSSMIIFYNPQDLSTEKELSNKYSAALTYIDPPRNKQKEEKIPLPVIQKKRYKKIQDLEYREKEVTSVAVKTEDTVTFTDVIEESFPAENPVKNQEYPADMKATEHQHSDNARTMKQDAVFRELRSKIEKYKIYPPVARKRGIEGTVIVLISLDAQGNLVECKVAESSGHRILDNAALEIINRILPCSHSPGVPVDIKIPIVYTIL